MHSFDPSAYGAAIAAVLKERRLAERGPARPNRAAHDVLAALTIDRAFPAVRDIEMARACLAGLWLYHDFLDESHAISQEIETPTGSYWHGLLHRREADYGNSKYWFRRVGRHAVFVPLVEEAQELAAAESHASIRFLRDQEAWDPFAFVDLCESVAAGRSPCQDLCRQVQLREWELLFDFCYRQATGLE